MVSHGSFNWHFPNDGWRDFLTLLHFLNLQMHRRIKSSVKSTRSTIISRLSVRYSHRDSSNLKTSACSILENLNLGLLVMGEASDVFTAVGSR